MPIRLLTVLALALPLALAGCGGGSGSTTASSAKSAGNPADRDFAASMIMHHRMAIQMATMARDKAEHPQVKTLAGEMIKAQQSEITTLRATDAKLQQAGIAKGDLGVPASQSAMNMKMGGLENANPFDRMFIDMMVTHHKGAIAMARAELSKGKNATLRDLAEQVISAQKSEVTKMQDWRKRWYGSSMSSSMNMGQ